MTRDDLVTLDGVTQSFTEWAADYGITVATIMNRIRVGMPVDRAITKPMHAKPGDRLPDQDVPKRIIRTLDFNGRTMTLRQWADELGLSYGHIHSRLALGWPVETILTTPKLARGVSPNFPPSLGTGGGPVAQETPNMDFSK